MKYVNSRMKNNKKKKIALIIVFIFFLNPLTLLAENRIISLIPSSTEILFAIGFGKEIIAVSNYCNYPEDEIKSLPRIGDQNLNVEKIISLKPTILVDTNHIHQKYENIFKSFNLNYVNIDIASYSDIPKAACLLAKLLGNPQKADNFVSNWNSEIDKVNIKSNSKTIKIYAEISDNPYQAVGGNNNINSIIQIAGGKNIFDKQSEYPIVNSEMLLLSNPEIIILIYPDANVESIKNRTGWNNIKAVKNNNIFIVNQDIFVRPGPRNLQAIKILNNLINKVIEGENK